MSAARVAVAAALLAVALGCNRGASEGVLDPSNELPFGSVDQPAAKSQTGASTPVGGWAMDDHEVREVRIYVDNRLAEVSTINTERPDVSKVFPAYAHATHCLLYTSPSPRDGLLSRMPSSA